METTPPERPSGGQLFAVSFIALFLELMVIRWAPSALRMVAYYANLMLLSSFLGLGIGSLRASRGRRWFEWFPVLLLGEVGLMFLCRKIFLPGSDAEARFFALAHSRPLNYAALLSLFIANAAVFVPLGQRIGSLIDAMPPLRAYAWDLGGSLCGTLGFGLFSYWYFSPTIGMIIVTAMFLAISARRQRWIAFLCLLAALALMRTSEDPASLWSPYYYVTVEESSPTPARVDLRAPLGLWSMFRGPAASSAASLRAMPNPPQYDVHVNHDFYQPDFAIDPARYSDSVRARDIATGTQAYFLPYALFGRRDRVLVLGAGGGTDVEAALMAGARSVDAVEIDPVLVSLSRRLNASGVYDDPRVAVHVDDAREYVRRAEPGYDLVVFGWLDSQALFSQMSNIRLDGYVYTVESIRSAYRLLNSGGALALSFMAGQRWLADKLVRMVGAAVGRPPIIYFSNGQVILCVPRGGYPPLPARIGRFLRIPPNVPSNRIEPPTDDWPYLYLSGKAIPGDYALVIGFLMLLSFSAVIAMRGGGFDFDDGHFFFLGFGFMLLETTQIADCSLYFGTTWLVTLLVVAGILLMAMGANFAALLRVRRFSPTLYAPLLAALAVLCLVPRELVLAWPYLERIAWTVLAVPIPVFFAGLIFSTSFRESSDPAALFGANLLGAMTGGFCEYLGMSVGHSSLSLLIIAAYLAALWCRLRGRSAAFLGAFQ